MDINKSTPSQSKTNKTGAFLTSATNRTTDVSRTNANPNSNSGQNIKTEFKEGQLIKGQIIDRRYNEVKVNIEPGNQVITAKLTDDIMLSIGQEASFMVSEADSEQLVLRYLPDEASSADSVIIKALSAASIAQTKRNKAIVAELLNQRMPVDKQTLQALIRYSTMNREASPICLILMFKNNIPINANNLQQFQAYLEGTHQLFNNIKAVTQNISKFLMQSANNESTNRTDIYESVNNAVNQEVSSNAVNAEVSSNADNAEVSNNAGQLIPAGLTEQTESNINLNTFMHLDNALDIKNNQPDKTLTNNGQLDITQAVNNRLVDKVISLNNMLMDILVSEANDSGTDLTQTSISSFEKTASQNIQLSSELLEQTVPMHTSNLLLGNILNTDEIDLLLKYLSKAPDYTEMKASISNGTATINDTLTYIQKALTDINKDTASILLTSQEYTKLLEKAFCQKWTLSPENITKEHSIQDLYNQLNDDLRSIESLVHSTIEDDDKAQLQKPLQTVHDNLQFIRDLNNAFTFLQLPVQYKDREMHADLYILSRKKARNDDQNISVNLHLETVNLGTLNIHLKMLKKRIDTSFYPENNVVAQIVKDNIPSLITNLQKKGYVISAEVMDTKEEPGFFKNFIEQNTHDYNTRRFNFDIRT